MSAKKFFTLFISTIICVSIIAFSLTFPSIAIAGTWMDDFEDGILNGWQKWEWLGQNTGTLEGKNGLLILTDVDSNFDTAATFNNGQYVGDFILSVDAKMAKAFEGDKSYMQIIFRSEWQNGDSRLAFNSYYPNGEAFLGMFSFIKNNAREVGKQKLPFKFELNKWYKIKLDLKATQVMFVKRKVPLLISGKCPTLSLCK